MGKMHAGVIQNDDGKGIRFFLSMNCSKAEITVSVVTDSVIVW